MNTERTEFDYLLNRFELASQSDTPAEHGYATHRAALFDYVLRLERAALAQPNAAQVLQWLCDKLNGIGQQERTK